MRASGWKRAIYAALAAGVLFYQLFATGFIGLADNGDFPRVAGRFSLCPERGWEVNRFHYFIPEYAERPSCHWESEVPTSALLLMRAARAISPGPVFPIRTLGLLHAAILVGLTAVWPPLLLFCDLANTAYFNSFFLDGFALLALLATVAAARWLLRSRSDRAIALYTAAAIFLITSKLQHAMLAVPLALFLIALVRWRAAVPSAALVLCAVLISAKTPTVYRVTNLWNSIFVGLVPNSPTALAELHLSADYAAFANRNAYQFPSQQQAEYWETRLGHEMSYATLARYYLTHPMLALTRTAASARGLQHLRPDYLGNTQPGTAPFTQSHRFDFYSTAKAYLFTRAPYVTLLIYAAAAFAIPRPLALLLASMAGLEFLTSTFADSVLDYRHHALLQQLGDLWLICAATSLGVTQGRLAGIAKRI